MSGLEGLRVVAFESRLAREMADLIHRHGGIPVIAPSMREVPLRDNVEARDWARCLVRGEFDVVIFLTGVGTRTLAAAVEDIVARSELAEALRRVVVVARGPKVVAALRELNVTDLVAVPEPNTWRDLLRVTAARIPLAGKRVAVQEYGAPNRELVAGLEEQGATVLRVPVYRWALPADVEPLRAAARRIAAEEADVALFTNAAQVDHLFQLAAESGLAEGIRKGFTRILVASVGPVCSESLRRHGIEPDLEPERPKMGFLVAEVARRASADLERKRATAS